MTRHLAVWALAGAGVLAFAGCGEGQSTRSNAPASQAGESSAASTNPPPTARARRGAPSAPPPVSQSTPTRRVAPPWPGGDRTPPPTVVDQGNDYVAIWYSLDGYRTWLEQHHPDPGLIPRVWVKGGSLAAAFAGELSSLASHHARSIDINERLHVRVADVADHEVTLIVDEHNDGERAVDDAGHVIRTRSQPLDARYVVLMDRDPEGHWRLVSAAPQITNDTEVHL